jgi:predicted RNA-binding protein YlqC (UPF0109 family)
MLLFVVRALVDHPDDVKIVLQSNPEGSIFCIRAHPRDVAELIGKGSQSGLPCAAS